MVGPDSEPSPQPPSGHSHTGPTGRSGVWGGRLGLRAGGDQIQSRWGVKDLWWLLELPMGSQEGSRLSAASCGH